MTDLNVTFESSKRDITSCWETPLNESDRVTGEWIYSVDPETMNFVKAMFKFMPGDYSLYKTFVAIMKGNNVNALLNL